MNNLMPFIMTMQAASPDIYAPSSVSYSSNGFGTYARSGIYMSSNGNAYEFDKAAYIQSFLYLLDNASSDYEVRMTFVSGDALLTGTLNTWLSLGTSRTWYNYVPSTTGFLSKTTVLTMEIREAVSEEVLTTTTVTLYSESEDDL